MATVKENLIAARALIDTPEKWGKGAWHSRGCFCAIGAVLEAQGKLGRAAYGGETEVALMHALPAGIGSVEDFNDQFRTTHADIMALFDRAIEAQP
jgi:hypothetical protein